MATVERDRHPDALKILFKIYSMLYEINKLYIHLHIFRDFIQTLMFPTIAIAILFQRCVF